MKNFLILIALLILTFTKAHASEMGGLSTLSEVDYDKGIELGEYSIANDSSKLSLSYNLNFSAMEAMEITSYDASYSFKLDFFGERTWVDFGYQQTSGTFDKFSTPSSTLHSGLNEEDVKAQTISLSTFYLGGTIQSSLVQNIIQHDRLFESLSAAVTYNSYTEDLLTDSMTGYGLKSALGLYIRSSKNMHYGLKMTYNMATVTRSPEEGETKSQNTLQLSWATAGLDLSFYF